LPIVGWAAAAVEVNAGTAELIPPIARRGHRGCRSIHRTSARPAGSSSMERTPIAWMRGRDSVADYGPTGRLPVGGRRVPGVHLAAPGHGAALEAATGRGGFSPESGLAG